MSAERKILVAEDDESDVFLLQRAFKEAGLAQAVQFAYDGQEAIDILSRQRLAPDDRLPALVILDLKMPRRGGMDVLRWIRADLALKSLPVMIFSSSSRREDIEQAYALGANAFAVKPPSTTHRAELARWVKDWLRFNEPPLISSEGFKAALAGNVEPKVVPPATPPANDSDPGLAS